MDKNAIKKYAVWARRELIARVTQKAEQYEITENKITRADAESIGGKLLSETEKNQRKALIEKIEADGFEQVMEEVAYTWFNRFTALRFMEVNNYLPSHTRVFTNEQGAFKPQILSDAISLEMEGLNIDKVYALKDSNKTEELYKYLLITQCNAMSGILPRMFQKIEDYTELLLPDYLLREGSVIEQMITLIPEEDWTDQVQIIGWLYQYYNTEPKDMVFANLKKNIKITKENIPAATQLFTPDWIVRYMVENSLGRIWLEGHPNDALKSEWKYYLDEAEQEADVQRQLDEIRKEYAALKPEEIRCIDPCMGSGHILCYMFDVLVQIYEDYGYTAREAVSNIVEKNLWGLDIDERAAQLSYFAVMMKARQYDRRFLTRGIQPHVYAIEDSNGITSAPMHDMGIELSQDEYGKAVKYAMRLVEELNDAKEYGSIIDVSPCDWDLLRRFAVPRGESIGQLMLDIHGEIRAAERLQELINIGEALAQKYHIVVTNPPYMGANGVADKLSHYIKENYPDGKSDLFSVFIERCGKFTCDKGYYGMITQPSVLFLTSFSTLRKKLIETQTISSLLHMGRGIFGIDFGSTSFVIRNNRQLDYKGVYFRLHERTFQYIDPDDIARLFLEAKNNHSFKYDFGMYKTLGLDCEREEGANNDENESAQHTSLQLYFENTQNSFLVIPGNPFAYWLSEEFVDVFKRSVLLGKIADSKQGVATADNNRFLRAWYEVCVDKIFFDARNHEQAKESPKKWYPYNKGGEFRKWYGNDEYVVDWQYDGQALRSFKKAVLRNPDYYFRECFSWSLISSGIAAFRYKTPGKIFDVAGMSCFTMNNLFYLLALCNSVITTEVLRVIAPTINYQCGDIANIPVLMNLDKKPEIEKLSKVCVELSKDDWDDYEVSWDFSSQPLVKHARNGSVYSSYQEWERICDVRFTKVKEAEEAINSLFIDIYGLSGELEATVQDKHITIRKADLKRDISSLISYAVGCMFGRYSLDAPGLIYAGGKWDMSKYGSFTPDKDAIIPICDDEYFEDDIVGRFIQFIKIVYGKESLEENLQFIADALGGKGTSREVIRSYFINDFFKDHLKIYQKRPIYWLFDSGKKNGFKCLVYMHRYQPDTIARIRTDYVHEQQSRYRTAIASLEQRINGISTSERVKLNKQLTKLQAQAEEIRLFEEKIHHLADQMMDIDLDDGVKVNYAKFQDVLAKIK